MRLTPLALATVVSAGSAPTYAIDDVPRIFSTPLGVPERAVTIPQKDKPKKRKDLATAKAYNISEPVYICPKPNYELVNEDCIFVDTVPARFECPVGYKPVVDPPYLLTENEEDDDTDALQQFPRPIPSLPDPYIVPPRPRRCIRVVPPVLTCLQGSLVDDDCKVAEFTEPVITCPPGTSPAPGDTCVRHEESPSFERCPEGSSRMDGECVRIEYIEPHYVCPADSVQEGRKCRREVVSYKKKRMLLADGEAVEENIEPEQIVVGRNLRRVEEEDDIELEEIDLADLDLPEYLAQDLSETTELQSNCKPGSRECTREAWHPVDQYREKEEKDVRKDDVRWQKVKVQVPVVKVKKDREPKRVVRVQKFPAERVCSGKGERYGSNCIMREIVPPVRDCPPHKEEHHGRCIQEDVVAASISCPIGRLVCPPSLPGRTCKCETYVTVPPVQTCQLGGALENGECVSFAQPKPYCPLGYFLDIVPGDTCTRRDVEPALCLFSVTYFCPDCEDRMMPQREGRSDKKKEKDNKQPKYVGYWDADIDQ